MQYVVEQKACRFEFWGGAKQRMEYATDEQREAVYDRMEEFCEFDNVTETDINDLVWFDCDDIFR